MIPFASKANISLSRFRARILIALSPIEEEIRGPPFGAVRANLLARNPPRIHACRSRSPYHTHLPRSYATRSSLPLCVRREPREKQSVPFTGNVYMDRLRSPSRAPLASGAFGAPGISRMRLDNRRGYPANIMPLHGYPCCGFRPVLVLSSPCRCVSAFRPSSIRAHLRPRRAAPLNRKAAYTK